MLSVESELHITAIDVGDFAEPAWVINRFEIGVDGLVETFGAECTFRIFRATSVRRDRRMLYFGCIFS